MDAVTNEMSKQQNTKTSADSGRQAPTDHQLVRHCALACTTTSLTSTLGQFIRKADVHEAE
jgi:hypothetical protein